MRLFGVSKTPAGSARRGGLAAVAAVVMTVLALSLASIGPTAAAGVPSASGADRSASKPSGKPLTGAQPHLTTWTTLDASPHTVNHAPIVGVSASTTLSVYTPDDLSSTPYYMQIWNLSTGALVTSCGLGNTCSTTVSEGSSITLPFVATIARLATSYPPTDIQATSMVQYVTWFAGFAPYYSASMSGLSQAYPPYNSVLTATSNADLSSTAYYIEIFDLATGVRVAYCGIGSTCSATVSHTDSLHTHVAFISELGATLLPPNIRASSNSM